MNVYARDRRYQREDIQGIQECNRDESDTPLTNKTYKKWSVIDKDGNDLVIQNLVPSITSDNEYSVNPDADTARIIHKTILDEAPANLRSYIRSKGYDKNNKGEEKARKDIQEYYAQECSKIAKTYPKATGFAINNFEKNLLLNKRDGLGRCVAFNADPMNDDTKSTGKGFIPCNTDSDCGLITLETDDSKEYPFDRTTGDSIHSTGWYGSGSKDITGGWTDREVSPEIWASTVSGSASGEKRPAAMVCKSFPTGDLNYNFGTINTPGRESDGSYGAGWIRDVHRNISLNH